ncbi:hypothetical protein J6590_015843 [Homalodisca vitripennis]|nr:hypothetical protein J6590_015843 [Homalodisca vitripennis]
MSQEAFLIVGDSQIAAHTPKPKESSLHSLQHISRNFTSLRKDCHTLLQMKLGGLKPHISKENGLLNHHKARKRNSSNSLTMC